MTSEQPVLGQITALAILNAIGIEHKNILGVKLITERGSVTAVQINRALSQAELEQIGHELVRISQTLGGQP